MLGKVYLIPTVLTENNVAVLPAYLLPAIKNCSVFFVENVKTTRRFFKQLWKEMDIDSYEWHIIHKAEEEVKLKFTNLLQQGKNIGIVSEAGCPGIADPGQILVAQAQQIKATVMPLVGPSSILLALMASGLNGQHFCFNGYLPIEAAEKKHKIKTLENNSLQTGCTHIFIETPYRNNQLLKDMVSYLQPNTKICVAVNITADNEQIITKTAADWKKNLPELHKQLAVFLIGI